VYNNNLYFRFMKITDFFFLLILVVNINAYSQGQQISLANEYYGLGELEKAKEIYDKLAKSKKNIPLIHNNYFELLLSLGEYELAGSYIEKIIKTNTDNLFYKIDKGTIYIREGNDSKAISYYKKFFSEIKKDDYKTRVVAQYLVKKQLLYEAETLYKDARKQKGDPYAYSVELANIYRIMNNKDKMVVEYLNFVIRNPRNINYVKNVFQSILTEPEDLESFETLLYDKIQVNPDNDVYYEMLIWVHLQQRNFYAAYIQARAYDKRRNKDGSKILEVGMISLENRDYQTAIEIFGYLEKNYRGAYLYPIAKRFKIKSREELVKETYPIDEVEIRRLVADYENLIAELGMNANTAEALRSKANLHAFYLDEKDSAIMIHNSIIGIPRIKPDLKAQCKLDLGDIYLLSSEPWESALLYSQVEKSRKETPIGYEAKLKNAKLSYYKGDFALAQSHLEILKIATSRKISNDAIALGKLIKDNTITDTSDVVLKKYAGIELLLFQNKREQAIDSLISMYSDFNGHSLTDEILWLLADTYMITGEFEKAIENLEEIASVFPEDILGDDALFRIGEIYELHLENFEKAQSVYQDFMITYPGSIYIAEARKRYRILRGDLVN